MITRYIYDAAGNLLAEADGSNNIIRYYIHGLGLLAMVTPADEIYCYHFDAIGSTIAMTDETQAMVNTYAYTPFGSIANEQESLPQPFKYVGQHGVMAEPNGFYYMRARYYDPQVGRFISEDPIGFAGGDVNLYAYVGNNPILFVDPWGLCGDNPQINQSGLNPFKNLPSFSEAFPESNFIAPTADIVVGGIEAGVAISFGVGGGITAIAGPEFWPISAPALAISVSSGWDAYGRIKTGVQRLNDR